MNETTENFFEQRMTRLQTIVEALEADDLPLEKSMSLYKEGLTCANFCKSQLEKARHEISVWQDSEMQPSLEGREETFSAPENQL
ncbi:MAG: exodeoxyribonuclease VII small subunit [Desulfovibrio sp.]|nr:exodeoxyribonuclease VII small subunit [Desulfovibrio sp.]